MRGTDRQDGNTQRIVWGIISLIVVGRLGMDHPASKALAATYGIGVLISITWEALHGE